MAKSRSLKGLGEKQYREIFEAWYPSLYYYAFKILKDEQAADDIVQEVFLHLWNQRKEIEFTHLKAHLYTTTRYKCMNHFRHEKVRTDYIASEQEAKKEEIGYTMAFLEEEVGRELLLLLDRLPTQRKTVFLLHIEGYTQEEIAQKLNISVNTVKTHKLRARTFLKEILRHSFYTILPFI